MENETPSQVNPMNYYWVSSTKFILMSLCTFGFYQIYWSYKNWSSIKEQDQSKIQPVWRSIFYPLWYFYLLSDLGDRGKSLNLSRLSIKVVLVVATVILNYAGWFGGRYIALVFFSFIPLLPAVKAISEINVAALTKPVSQYHTKANIITYLVGGPLMIFTILSTVGLVSPTKVIQGDQLFNRDITFLRSEKILGDKEEILFFYSDAIISIKSDGQFITNEYVTSYFLDSSNDSLIVEHEKYDNISDIQVAWAKDWLDTTVVTIVDRDGGSFELWLSSEENGDRLFVDTLRRIWKDTNSKVNEVRAE